MKLLNHMVLLTIAFGISCHKDNFLEGYDQQTLFADPSAEDLAAVKDDWAARDLSPRNYKVEQQVSVASDGTTLKIVSFNVGGSQEYGALLVPKSTTAMPVRMYIGGFAKGITTNSIKLEPANASSGKPFIFAFPALRGQSLSITVNDIEYTSPLSEGIQCDAFDGAADDGIAFLNIIQQMEEKADMDRVSVRGGSRGGAVALLIGERDIRVKFAIGVAGPTDMIALTATHQNDLTYQCQFLDNLVHGGGDINSVRHKMIASSPLYFAEHLPKTQVHFAANDNIVPIAQGEKLLKKMNELSHPDQLEFYLYEGRDHFNIAEENEELKTRIEQFLSQL